MSRRRDPQHDPERVRMHTLRFVCSRGHPEQQVGPSIRLNPEGLDRTYGETTSDDGAVTPLADVWPVLYRTGDASEPGIERVPGKRRRKVRLICPEVSCPLDVPMGPDVANAVIREYIKAGVSRVELVDLARMLSRNSP